VLLRERIGEFIVFASLAFRPNPHPSTPYPDGLGAQHFEGDVTYMTGAVIHHAEESSPGMNLAKQTLAEGYLMCGASQLPAATPTPRALQLFFTCTCSCAQNLALPPRQSFPFASSPPPLTNAPPGAKKLHLPVTLFV